ncbi:MAG: outer membrane protein assembly factor, partial [Parachlamydiaceae bacterium]|nr:outer membrane protein assembly factor [Parachlamydiaceae bacterium]
IWLLDGHHNHNKSYTETTFSFSGIIERKVSERLQISYGGMYKILRSMHSANNGIFDLIKVPLQLRWTNADSLLDPTRGMTVQLRATPSLQIRNPRFAYSINTFTGTHYQSLRKDHSVIFATKLTVGSIFGASNHDIPPPERFYAGSENTLRGYRFLTVSPLGRRDKPLGGRSLLIYTLELRTKIQKNFGLVFFYDIGNVYKNFFPNLKKGILQSTGLGIRYYTPIGPVRLDIAFPLNRRKKLEHRHGHIDSVMEAYFSIGQSF